MSAKKQEGRITYINHEKKYAMLEYEAGGKKRVVKAVLGSNKHHFSTGDVVHFNLSHITGTDRQEASNLQFKFNTALDALLQKAKTHNNLLGYIKEVDGQWFIKEINSYLFFKLDISKWQIAPDANQAEAVSFYFEDPDRRDKLVALLFDNVYVAEYRQAMKMHKQQSVVPAVVSKITPHSVYLNIVGDVVQAKIPANNALAIGDTVPVRITHLGRNKIAAEVVEAENPTEGLQK